MKKVLTVAIAIWLVLLSTALASGGTGWIEEFEISVPSGTRIHSVSSISPDVKPGEYVQFGCYPQTVEGDDQTPIEWRVLDVQGNKALLFSRYGLDWKRYNKRDAYVTWENCSLREWLNSTFLNKAFSEIEQEAILMTNVDNGKDQGYSGWKTKGGNNTQDRIFLLSYSEAWKYFKSDDARKCQTTKYAVAQGAYNYCFWWLRSPGDGQNTAALVNSVGFCSDRNVSLTRGVRPALWINLESGIF